MYGKSEHKKLLNITEIGKLSRALSKDFLSLHGSNNHRFIIPEHSRKKENAEGKG